jgi:signal peptidase I
MRARGWTGEAWLPVGWPAGQTSSPAHTETAPIDWRRIVFGRDPNRTLRRVLIWTGCTLVLLHFLLVPIKVVGASMMPTYRDGAVNMVNRLAYAHGSPKRGDVVVLHDGQDLILKRIIAVPGETIELDRGRFKINGAPLRDEFSVTRIEADFDPITLGPNEYFVIGDNRAASIFGKFPKQAILGKIVF